MRLVTIFCFVLLPWFLGPAPRLYGQRTISVAADASVAADFRTIQDALDAIPDNNRERIVVFVHNGVYCEKIRIDQDRITLRGESREGVRIEYFLPRTEYDRRYDAVGPAVVNVFGDDVIVENLTIENTQESREHAFAIYGQPQRMILDRCDVLSHGADTVSLWNTAAGMYYHRQCRFRGGVDFVCPRGWCYVEQCEFQCPTTSAAIWHDGHMDHDMKFVLRDCTFTGNAEQPYWLGRNHYACQFYLLNCRFDQHMADKPIGVVGKVRPGNDPALYERKFFHQCHREGGDYDWHKDNLVTAPGQPRPDQITAAWTFGYRWDPESQAAPTIDQVEVAGEEVFLYFNEDVAGAGEVRVTREDGTFAAYRSGSGTRHWRFEGGTMASPPVELVCPQQTAYATTATLKLRYLDSQALPTASPRRQRTMVLVGDSTVASYPADSHSQGWGHALPLCFDDRLTIVNLAKGGRSSKSFREEGLWEQVRGSSAHYVLIQFGHNDNPGKGPERETDPGPEGDFRENLRRYVKEARDWGAIPVLVTPPPRRHYDAAGQIQQDTGNARYAAAARAVAQELACPLVDLQLRVRETFDRYGESSCDWMQPVGDRTHFTPAGARRIAEIVAAELLREVPELRPYNALGAIALPYCTIPEAAAP